MGVILQKMIRPLCSISCLLAVIFVAEVTSDDAIIETKRDNKYLIKTGEKGRRNDNGASDYDVIPVTSVIVTKGENAKLKCESEKEFKSCKFKEPWPSRKVHDIGIGGVSSYTPKKVDCLCSVEEYDPTRTCGIIIYNVTKQDLGHWRCIMEYEKKKKRTESFSLQYPPIVHPKPPKPGLCQFTRDCQAEAHCQNIADAGCLCIHGICIIKGFPMIYGDECKSYTDCKCRGNPEKCYCKGGFCDKTKWECHKSTDCKKMKKCKGKKCVCTGNLCEFECRKDEDCADFDCNKALGKKCKCENSLCAYKWKPRECKTISDCVAKGFCEEDKPCACERGYCTVPSWVKDNKYPELNCRNDKDCEDTIELCKDDCTCENKIKKDDMNSERGTCAGWGRVTPNVDLGGTSTRSLLKTDPTREVKDIKQCKQDGVKNCRAVEIDFEYLEKKAPGDSFKFIEGSDLSMKLRRPPTKSSSGGLSFSFILSDGGEATVSVGPGTAPSMFGSIRPNTGSVMYSVESCGQGCNVLYERDLGYFNQFED